MEWNLGTILILIVVLLVGYGLGLLEAYLRNSGKLKEAQREIAELQAAKENAIPDSTTTTSALTVDLNPDQSIDIKLDGSGRVDVFDLLEMLKLQGIACNREHPA